MKSIGTMVLLLSSFLGCATAPPPRDVGDLLNEARANEVAAFAKNRGQRLRAVGVVTATGLDQFTQVATSGVYWGFGLATTQAGQVAVVYPYVAMAGAAGNPYDLVRCYFAPSRAAEVGRVTRGTRLVVHGIFDQYAHQPPALTLILSSCMIE